MNAYEYGARIQQMSTEVVESVNGTAGQVAGMLADAFAGLAQVKYAAENPTSEVAAMLGESHSGTDAIVGNTANVTVACESVAALMQEAIGRIEEIYTASSNLGFVYNNVGASIAGGV